jgi:hypothetical protein
MKIKILPSVGTLAIAMLAVTSFFEYAKAAESDVPEPGDCPDPTDPLCPPATATNQSGNAAASSSSATNMSATK